MQVLARKWIISGAILIFSLGIILTGVAFQSSARAEQKQESFTGKLIYNKSAYEFTCDVWIEFMGEYQ